MIDVYVATSAFFALLMMALMAVPAIRDAITLGINSRFIYLLPYYFFKESHDGKSHHRLSLLRRWL